MRRSTPALTQSWSYGEKTLLRALFFCAVALGLLPGCGSSDPTEIAIVVQVESLTNTAIKLTVSASLDSKQAMQNQDVTGDLTNFGVRLPLATTGALILTVDAYDSSRCKVAQGRSTSLSARRTSSSGR